MLEQITKHFVSCPLLVERNISIAQLVFQFEGKSLVKCICMIHIHLEIYRQNLFNISSLTLVFNNNYLSWRCFSSHLKLCEKLMSYEDIFHLLLYVQCLM